MKFITGIEIISLHVNKLPQSAKIAKFFDLFPMQVGHGESFPVSCLYRRPRGTEWHSGFKLCQLFYYLVSSSCELLVIFGAFWFES